MHPLGCVSILFCEYGCAERCWSDSAPSRARRHLLQTAAVFAAQAAVASRHSTGESEPSPPATPQTTAAARSPRACGQTAEQTRPRLRLLASCAGWLHRACGAARLRAQLRASARRTRRRCQPQRPARQRWDRETARHWRLTGAEAERRVLASAERLEQSWWRWGVHSKRRRLPWLRRRLPTAQAVQVAAAMERALSCPPSARQASCTPATAHRCEHWEQETAALLVAEHRRHWAQDGWETGGQTATAASIRMVRTRHCLPLATEPRHRTELSLPSVLPARGTVTNQCACL